MVLLFQLSAVLLAGSVASVAWSSSKTSPQAIARSIVILAVAFAYVAFWGKLWQTSKSLLSQHSNWKTLTPAQAAVAGTPGGVRGSFAEWIRGRLGPGERFYLVPSPTQDVSVYQWFTYRLLPNLNALGIPGWWAKNRIGASSLDTHSLTVYEAVLPIWRAVERRARLPWGLSLIAHAEQP
jgi:hypothetical protein